MNVQEILQAFLQRPCPICLAVPLDLWHVSSCFMCPLCNLEIHVVLLSLVSSSVHCCLRIINANYGNVLFSWQFQKYLQIQHENNVTVQFSHLDPPCNWELYYMNNNWSPIYWTSSTCKVKRGKDTLMITTCLSSALITIRLTVVTNVN